MRRSATLPYSAPMRNRTFIVVLLVVVVLAVIALESRREGGSMLHRLGAAIHGR